MSRTPENPNRAPASSGPPLRAFAMVLISLAIVFAGLGFASLGGSDDETPAAAPATTTTATSTPAASPPRAGLAAAPSATPGASASTPTTPAPATSVTATSAAASPGIATSGGTALGTTSARAPVRVFNNSNIAGLAAQTATFLEDEGFTISETGNYSEGLLTQTAVYYGTSPGEQQTAQAVADALGISAQPRFAGIQSAAPGVIVIVTSP